jgi:hypothetical protein
VGKLISLNMNWCIKFISSKWETENDS